VSFAVSEIRIGVIGDLHTHWDDIDVVQFNRSSYDLLVFIGDLGGGTSGSSLRIARSISRLKKETLVIPGNNDVCDMAELAAELVHRSGLRHLDALRTGAEHRAPVRLCGYSAHRLTRGSMDVTLIVGRPHSLGGSELSFPDHMASNYGVETLEASTERLRALVDEVETEAVIFFSHNGPTGLGDRPSDMWGCDFRPGGGDWGDPDLEYAIDRALERGKRVLAVVAGHMHRRTRQGAERDWITERQETLFVNAARVPRILAVEDEIHRHHVAITVRTEGISIEEVLLPHP
jgi:uncharacterized protein (TIGR04168 family)